MEGSTWSVHLLSVFSFVHSFSMQNSISIFHGWDRSKVLSISLSVFPSIALFLSLQQWSEDKITELINTLQDIINCSSIYMQICVWAFKSPTRMNFIFQFKHILKNTLNRLQNAVIRDVEFLSVRKIVLWRHNGLCRWEVLFEIQRANLSCLFLLISSRWIQPATHTSPLPEVSEH